MRLNEFDEVIFENEALRNTNDSFLIIHKKLVIFSGLIVAVVFFLYYYLNHHHSNYFKSSTNNLKIDEKNQEKNMNNNNLRFTHSIELLTPIKDSELKQFESFGHPINDSYPSNHIGRIWFTVKYNEIKSVLICNIIKAQNLPSLFYQNEPSTLVRAMLIVNKKYDKKEIYDTQMNIKNRNPMYLEAIYIPLTNEDVARAILCLHVFEIHPLDFLRKTKLGSAYYPLNALAYQTCDLRFVWRDLVYPHLKPKKHNKKIINKKENKGEQSKSKESKGAEKLRKSLNLACDTELVYYMDTKILKIIIYTIECDKPNNNLIQLCVNGFVKEQKIFAEYGAEVKLAQKKIRYDNVFQTEIFENELPHVKLSFEIFTKDEDGKKIQVGEYCLDKSNFRYVNKSS